MAEIPNWLGPKPGVAAWLPPLPREVWVNGPICSGKDFVAEALHKYEGYWYVGVGRLIALEIEAERGLAPGTVYANKDFYRAELQYHGNLKRAGDPDYWIKAWIAEREKHADLPAVQPSCRFIRETKIAMSRGAVVVRVETPYQVRAGRISVLYPSHTAAVDTDAAESEVDRVPYHIQLPGTLRAEQVGTALRHAVAIWEAAGKPVLNDRELNLAT